MPVNFIQRKTLPVVSIDEALCVQIMHIEAFDNEPETVAIMDKYLRETR